MKRGAAAVIAIFAVAFVALAEAHAATTCGYSTAAATRRVGLRSVALSSAAAAATATTKGKRFYSDTPAPIRVRYDTRWIDDATTDAYACWDGRTSTIGTYTCDAQNDVLTPAKKLVAMTLLNATRDLLGELLQVAPVDGALTLPAGVYDGNIDLASAASANATDLLVFVTARPSTANPNVIGTGLAIATDATYGRPLAGALNLCPSKLPADLASSAMVARQMAGVVLHEMLHVLGFAGDMFDTYVDGDGAVRTEVYASATVDGRPLAMLATPAVVAWVREHFGCSTLPGAALEDQGGAGTAGSHWEKASFMDELMTGVASSTPVLSGLTLAALADSGWYVVDNTRAEWLLWGEGKGCDFMLNRCNSGWPRSGGYFCTQAGATSCTYNRLATGACTIREYSSITPTYFQYFTNPLQGGPIEVADYCPFVLPFSDGWCMRTTTSSADQYGQMLGESSRCFESSLQEGSLGSTVLTPRCFPTFCASSTELKVRIGTYWYACNGTSNITNVEGFAGVLTCPDPALICGGTTTTSTLFPVLHRIDPTEAYLGDTITLYGANFANGSVTVDISGVCADPLVSEGGTVLTCTLGSTASVKSMLGLTVDVVITQNGFALIQPKAITISTDWAAWASRNAFLLFALLLSILVLGFTFCVIGVKIHDRHKADKEWKRRRRQEQFDTVDI